MAHFTLSKFKKARQLAFLYLFALFLFSCGGGGGSSNPLPVTEISSGFAYTSIGDWGSTFGKFYDDCESENANCTEQQARSILEAAISAYSIETQAVHLYSDGSGSVIHHVSGESSYSLAIQGNSLMETLKFNPAVSGTPLYPGFEVTSDFYSYPSFSHDFPGALSGLLSLEHERIGITDSSLNEKVFKGIHIRPLPNSGIMWSGTQYSWAEIAELDYGNACDYLGDPRYCQRVSLDNSSNISLVGKIYGPKTNAGDMPASGSTSYRSYAISKGFYEKGNGNFLYTGNFSMVNSAGCGSNPPHRGCHWKTSDAVSAEQILTVDFSANSIQGTLSMQKHYYESSSGSLTLLTSSSYDLHKETLENLSISATISGNGFTGTVQNSHFIGNIYGNFYGPNAKEIGAIIFLSPAANNVVVSGSYYESEVAFSIIVISGSK
tara:strand:- start:565 stop:1872 length:1308 start_codon:yes stop_codon:yes gene_type:complete